MNRTAAFATLLAVLPVLAVRADPKPAETAPEAPPARECRVRGGLPEFFAKAAQGEEIKVAYFGGSITQQSGYRVHTFEWLRERYSKAKFVHIDASLGGCGSMLGVFRTDDEIVRQRPDLVFVEFAVNDGGRKPEMVVRCMEGIVRKLLRRSPDTELCFVYTVRKGPILEAARKGECHSTVAAMEKVADHYGIPSIHMGLEVARMVKEGKLIFEDRGIGRDDEKTRDGKPVFSADGVHPFVETGHRLYAEAVARGMRQIETARSAPARREVPKPLNEKNWVHAKMIPVRQVGLTEGWERLDTAKCGLFLKRYARYLSEVYRSDKAGEAITLRFKGPVIGLFGFAGPSCGQLRVFIDGKEIAVEPWFGRYSRLRNGLYHFVVHVDASGARIPVDSKVNYLKRLGKDIYYNPEETQAVHTARFEIHPDPPDKAAILARWNRKLADPQLRDRTDIFAGRIMLLGELVREED